MNIFTAVKENVTAREAAEAYGLAVSAKGMACCPFHDDRHPSMKLDERYYCFGCGEHGDVITFVANLYNLRPADAARKLAADFGIPVPDSRDDRVSEPSRSSAPLKKAVTSDEITRYFAVLTDYIAMLDEWFARYAPDSPFDEPHPRFLDAVRNRTFLHHMQDTLLTGSRDEQQKSAQILKERIHEFEEELARYRAETAG